MVSEHEDNQLNKDTKSAAIPFVSVIIPVYNDEILLRKCLQSLQEQTYPSEKIEIIVVDNGSDPNLNDLAREFVDVLFLQETRPGSYAARNTGIAQARGDILAFLDSDCRPAPDWLENGVSRLAEGDVVGGRIILGYQQLLNPTPIESYDGLTSFRQKEYVEKSHFSVTANLIARRSVFDTVGPFDLSLKSGGDCEWGNRVHKAGFKLVYADNAIIYHPARSSLEAVSRKQRRVGGGLGQKLRAANHINWKKVPRTELIEFLIFFRLCYEILFHEGIPVAKKIQMLLINIAISGLRIFELNKVLLGGKPPR